MKRSYLPLAFALVFLPPRKEMEDWQSSPRGKTIEADQLVETKQELSPTSTPLKILFKSEARDGRFSFNGKDTISFVLKQSRRPEWETKLPPTEKEVDWPSGAWSGLSLETNELSHFYLRQTKRGPEPRFRAYSLAPNLEQVDFALCEPRKAFLLQKEITSKPAEKSAYRLTLLTMAGSQELKRDEGYTVEVAAGQDLLNLRPETCKALVLDGWPKSFRISLK